MQTHQELWIGGRWRGADGGDRFEVVDPATEEAFA
jgi:acyl-CoA reductase-like NAD-dependent aldehyde dehydrogenase